MVTAMFNAPTYRDGHSRVLLLVYTTTLTFIEIVTTVPVGANLLAVKFRGI
jgi:hypothetical protein